ncbi:OTU domain-containing protein [Legionella sp. CNM-1927-20]|uniref:OTU domain-containing protein n=1 Tax=Legionella sp. CNM-1927-20 TaxID=3422221 RepID=UPI00403AF4F7
MATTFFTSQKLAKRILLQSTGKVADSAFRAVAAALIDNVLNDRRITANKPLLDKILERYSKYFNLPEGAGLLTPTERLLQLINRPDRPEKMAKFVAEFAYTLRQIAMDQLLKDPERYMLTFLEENKDSSIRDMRDPNTTNGKTLIAALADALSIPIIINPALPRESLHATLDYGPDSKPSFNTPQGVQIRLEGKAYIPYLRNPASFQTTYSSNQIIHPKESVENDPPIETVLDKIDLKRQDLLASFKAHKRRLEFLVQDMSLIHGMEATKDQLIAIYISSVKDRKQLIESTKYVGTEHGSEHFFEVIQDNQTQRPMTSSSSVVSNPNVVNYDSHVIQELINTLAREMTIGRLDENLVYESLDQPTSHKHGFGVS